MAKKKAPAPAPAPDYSEMDTLTRTDINSCTPQQIRAIANVLLDALEETSARQSTIIRYLHAEGMTLTKVSSYLKSNPDKIMREESAGFKALFYLLMGDPKQSLFSYARTEPPDNDAGEPTPAPVVPTAGK